MSGGSARQRQPLSATVTLRDDSSAEVRSPLSKRLPKPCDREEPRERPMKPSILPQAGEECRERRTSVEFLEIAPSTLPVYREDADMLSLVLWCAKYLYLAMAHPDAVRSMQVRRRTTRRTCIAK